MNFYSHQLFHENNHFKFLKDHKVDIYSHDPLTIGTPTGINISSKDFYAKVFFYWQASFHKAYRIVMINGLKSSNLLGVLNEIVVSNKEKIITDEVIVLNVKYKYFIKNSLQEKKGPLHSFQDLKEVIDQWKY